MPSTPAVTAPPDDLHHVCRSSAMLFPHTPQPLRCIVHTACRSSTILVSPYPSTPAVHVQGDMHRAYCVQVINDSCSPIPINPLGPCSSKQFAAFIQWTGHQRFLFLYTHQPLWSMFLQIICITHTVCRSSTILIPPYPSAPAVHVQSPAEERGRCRGNQQQQLGESHPEEEAEEKEEEEEKEEGAQLPISQRHPKPNHTRGRRGRWRRCKFYRPASASAVYQLWVMLTKNVFADSAADLFSQCLFPSKLLCEFLV